jgi:hypothetical protein
MIDGLPFEPIEAQSVCAGTTFRLFREAIRNIVLGIGETTNRRGPKPAVFRFLRALPWRAARRPQRLK